MDKPAAPKLISVIIAARDEAKSLPNLISKVREALSGYSHEIVVVDDGSQDETAEIARRNEVIAVSHERNLGKGTAMKTSVQQACGDIIVFLDADGAHDPSDIVRIVAPILNGGADLVIGSRLLPESVVRRAPYLRRLSNRLASLLISIIISFLLPRVSLLKWPPRYIRITDCTSGFRGLSQKAWEKFDLVSQRFAIETEMVYEAARNRLRITEVAISCNWNSEHSRLSIARDGWRTLKLLTRKLVGDMMRRNSK